MKTPEAGHDKVLAKMEELASLLREAELILNRYEKGMAELVAEMKRESNQRWAKELPKLLRKAAGK